MMVVTNNNNDRIIQELTTIITLIHNHMYQDSSDCDYVLYEIRISKIGTVSELMC